MVRRVFWFATGLGFGTTFAVLVTRRVERAMRVMTPNSLVRRAGSGASGLLADVRDSWHEGVAAMHQREDDLWGVLPGAARGAAIEVTPRRPRMAIERPGTRPRRGGADA